MPQEDGPVTPGETRPVRNQTIADTAIPKLPHERDESASSQADAAPVDNARARKGLHDLERGVVDTDKGPVLDALYERMGDGKPRGDGKSD